jgi:hypothetical protein
VRQVRSHEAEAGDVPEVRLSPAVPGSQNQRKIMKTDIAEQMKSQPPEQTLAELEDKRRAASWVEPEPDYGFSVVRLLEDPIHDADARDLSTGKLKRMRPERRRFRFERARLAPAVCNVANLRADDEVEQMLRKTMKRMDDAGIEHD